MNPFRQGHDDKPDPVEINVTIRQSDASGLAELKTLILALSAQLSQVKESVMTSAADFQAGFARIDKATSLIAERLKALSANIGSMSADEETAAKAQLDALAATLEAMGANPDQPVPVPVPPEEPPVTP